MTTSNDQDPVDDDDLEIPELTSEEIAQMVPGPRRPPGVRGQIRIDGAVAYSVRVIPSNKVLGRFASTLDAWDLIEDEVDAGRHPKTLVLDWHMPDGETGKLSAGSMLVALARMSNGAPWPGDRSSRTVSSTTPERPVAKPPKGRRARVKAAIVERSPR